MFFTIGPARCLECTLLPLECCGLTNVGCVFMLHEMFWRLCDDHHGPRFFILLVLSVHALHLEHTPGQVCTPLIWRGHVVKAHGISEALVVRHADRVDHINSYSPLRYKKYTRIFFMYLKWTSVCYKCEAPLEPRVLARGHVNRSFIRAYNRIRPIFLGNNSMFYSFVGLKLERVCYGCFMDKVKIGPKLLRRRDIGQLVHIAPRSKAKTVQELTQWFDGLLRRAKANNLNGTYTSQT